MALTPSIVVASKIAWVASDGSRWGGCDRPSVRPNTTAIIWSLVGLFLTGCTPDLSCSGADVQAALHQALDNRYAESRRLSRVDLTIKDIVSTGQTEHGVSCKAVVHLDINYLGIAKTADPIILYTAERTDSGQVLVTAGP